MSSGIENKVVVITGASSGLGAETARHLAKAGAHVVLGARRIQRLESLARELHLDPEAIQKTDVTDRSQVKSLVNRAVALHGRIDVLLNNAGLMPSSMLDKLKVDEDTDIAAGMAKTYEKAIPSSSFARAVEFAISQPEDVDINEVLFRPTSQAY
ncbi:NADP-dependent 3-hydroxy acid dehydrogenase YdfG [Paraburkholderia youngii]|uniref:NADP-dependent 3-hydroxy acid dehydrogenase YdfG n=1 Tax=Paraburkholderia youngii TaxID=2782701 RepID=A0A7W8P1L5_9BURK|nr:SDR family NAD(P)-dependent oxidoreductase [Paraburkholderia youngii]MBB5399060.1 NADP-dependent 3-hydroxy acid dehydrogenase YdfG [Paraburkholderia youngii]NUX56173.1 SDR family NAD(P)-dependent oxidoreductase [Paraburkholderia youngii]NVI08357.1 SDR family NAD(P)-dependent oxidoreductase [Paraburkholderia youngii]